MANINVSSPSSFATLMISTATSFSTGTALTIPALQDITVNNNNGTFRWKQLDLTSQKVVATPATNSVAFNIVLDDSSFYGSSGVTAAGKGIFNLSNDKTVISFRMYWSGTGAGSKYVEGTGFIVGLAPKVNPDQPVWITPLTIEVDGNFTSGTV
jgi:hypothetical protein